MQEKGSLMLCTVRTLVFSVRSGSDHRLKFFVKGSFGRGTVESNSKFDKL